MSNSDLARCTAVKIVSNGVNITGSIQPYLKSVTYTDNEADEADDLQVQMHDRESVWMEKWLNDIVNAAASTSASSSTSDGDEVVYIVVRGDTLSGIAARYGTTYKVLAEYNGIKNPNLIYPGQKIRIPQAGRRNSSTVPSFKLDADIIQENWKSDGRSSVLPCGEFELDSLTASGPPAVITIKGTSLPFSSTIRQTKKSRAWESCALHSIAEEIAKANGMVCMYEAGENPFYSRVEQIKTSDFHFLETLCHNAGISLKATNRILVLFDQAAYESKAAIFNIKRGGGAYIKYKLNVGTADTKYSSCRVSYVDSTGKCISATAKIEDYNADTKNNQQLEITAKVASTAEAKALAEKFLRMHNKYAKTAVFTLPGNPDLVAGVTVTLEGWGVWNGKYIITQAKHTVNGSGYTVQVRLRRALEGY